MGEVLTAEERERLRGALFGFEGQKALRIHDKQAAALERVRKALHWLDYAEEVSPRSRLRCASEEIHAALSPAPEQAAEPPIPVVALHLHEARVGTLEVQLADLKRQLVTAMEQARAAEKKASRLAQSLERVLGVDEAVKKP